LPAEQRFSSLILNINSEIRDATTAVAVLSRTIDLRDNRDRLGAVESIDLIGDMTEKQQRTAQILARTRSVKSHCATDAQAPVPGASIAKRRIVALQQSTPPTDGKPFQFCSRQIDFGQPSRDTLLCGRLSCKISEAGAADRFRFSLTITTGGNYAKRF
jgi:hypothetical protein